MKVSKFKLSFLGRFINNELQRTEPMNVTEDIMIIRHKSNGMSIRVSPIQVEFANQRLEEGLPVFVGEVIVHKYPNDRGSRDLRIRSNIPSLTFYQTSEYYDSEEFGEFPYRDGSRLVFRGVYRPVSFSSFRKGTKRNKFDQPEGTARWWYQMAQQFGEEGVPLHEMLSRFRNWNLQGHREFGFMESKFEVRETAVWWLYGRCGSGNNYIVADYGNQKIALGLYGDSDLYFWKVFYTSLIDGVELNFQNYPVGESENPYQEAPMVDWYLTGGPGFQHLTCERRKMAIEAVYSQK